MITRACTCSTLKERQYALRDVALLQAVEAEPSEPQHPKGLSEAALSRFKRKGNKRGATPKPSELQPVAVNSSVHAAKADAGGHTQVQAQTSADVPAQDAPQPTVHAAEVNQGAQNQQAPHAEATVNEASAGNVTVSQNNAETPSGFKRRRRGKVQLDEAFG